MLLIVVFRNYLSLIKEVINNKGNETESDDED